MRKLFLLSVLSVLGIFITFQNNTYAQDCTNEITIDFEGVPVGTKVTNELSASGVKLVSALNADPSGPDVVTIFDSANPTGGDTDLGTPNSAFSGPGIGVGENNDTALGNLLIIAEDNVDSNSDGLIDDPDDEATGGDFNFNFTHLSRIKSITFVDIENGALVRGYNSSKNLTFAVEIDSTSDNSVLTTDLFAENAENNATLIVSLRDSGALAEVVTCHSDVLVEKNPLRINRACDIKKRDRRIRVNKRRLRRAGKPVRQTLSRRGKRAMRRGRC